ncbi:hypothetical protein QVD17_26008 [Tagetes erecta]|uniref:DUF674 family protein n=1 Tax=Tagetes erecta TaxID=13708 RepID=A0AAD8K5S0_TARER|nr:hypothetical protein QVD17_26008 [Tagetes erecta]
MTDKMEPEEAKISIKVFVDKVKKRVLYTEADHTFLDILFSFMTLPMGTIVRLLEKHDDTKFEALPSFNNLYQSLKDLPDLYFATEQCKSMLLNPQSVSYDHCRKLHLMVDDDTEPVEYLVCENCCPTGSLFSIFDKAMCLKCGKMMNELSYCSFFDEPDYIRSYDRSRKLKLIVDDTEPVEYYVCEFCLPRGSLLSIFDKAKCLKCGEMMNKYDLCDPLSSPPICIPNHKACVDGGVFVSVIATFMVTDDLSVTPYTATGCIQLLTDLGITDTSNLEELKIDIGCTQMLHLLKLSLSLDSPLTHLVFGQNCSFQDTSKMALSNLDPLSVFNDHGEMKKDISFSSKIVVELFLLKSSGKLLFAEAKKDFVDFLFGFLSISLATVTGTLMKGASGVSCMDNIFNSISNMSVGSYLKSQHIKDMLLETRFGQHYVSKNQLFGLEGTPFYRRNFKLKDPRIDEEYLKHSGMFIVTDDLVVTPSSSYSTIDALIKLKVQLDDIERHEISIGLEEGFKILKASLRSRSTLTAFFEHQLK